MSVLAPYRDAVAHSRWVQPLGRIQQVAGMTVEVEGLASAIGDWCTLITPAGPRLAEVVAIHGSTTRLLPFAGVEGLSVGGEVVPAGKAAQVGVGPALLGRVLDAFGQPLDGGAPPSVAAWRPLHSPPANPLRRPRIDTALETGIRAIDGLLTIGRGQRVGLFAGSGVGKSTLLGMIARHVKADVNVVALIGERGREVRDFVDHQLGPQGLARSVVVAAPADQPAIARLRAAHSALAMAEHFRAQGQHVVLILDSITRFAMARREVGLAAGEPPTARSYTPSVFEQLPQLCERCGTADSGGSITAFMTVLVEGDDFNEPVADTLRAILDGHIVLSRSLAQAGQYPAIDVGHSISRVMPAVAPPAQQALARQALETLALLERSRQLIDIGAYQPGANPALDRALKVQPALRQWLAQTEGGVPASEAVQRLAAVMEAAV